MYYNQHPLRCYALYRQFQTLRRDATALHRYGWIPVVRPLLHRLASSSGYTPRGLQFYRYYNR